MFCKEFCLSIVIKNTFFCKLFEFLKSYIISGSSERNITSMKRKFISHVKCEKQIKKVKNAVEDLVEVCYLDTIKSMVEAASFKECNGCNCSYEERVDLFYKPTLVKLMMCNDSVIKRFNDAVEIADGTYCIDDVNNAKKMLKCNVHRDKFCNDNIVYFKEKLLLFKH